MYPTSPQFNSPHYNSPPPSPPHHYKKSEKIFVFVVANQVGTTPRENDFEFNLVYKDISQISALKKPAMFAIDVEKNVKIVLFAKQVDILRK